LGYQSELMITHRALMLTITDESGEHLFSRIKRTSPHGVNFKLVSGLSHMSWNISEGDWTLDAIKAELDRLKSLAHYPRWLILLAIGFADFSFCRLWDGGIIEMLVAFVATVFGLYVRQETSKRNYNPYICIYLASLVASLISGTAEYFNIGTKPEIAFSTSVLFLVPGIPLINSITDLIDGNILNGIVRGINGLIIAFAIALGILTIKLIFQI